MIKFQTLSPAWASLMTFLWASQVILAAYLNTSISPGDLITRHSVMTGCRSDLSTRNSDIPEWESEFDITS